MEEKSNNILSLYKSLDYRDIEKMVENGDFEDQYLECKNPHSFRALNDEFGCKVAKEISGLSNAEGGIIIFGVQTGDKQGLDQLKQIETIASVDKFTKKLNLIIPRFYEPKIELLTRTVKKNRKDQMGLMLMYVPQNDGDPIECLADNTFYLRIGDKTLPMPFQTIRRMFLGSLSPNIDIDLSKKHIKKEGEKWKIGIIVENRSFVPAKSVVITINFENPNSYEILAVPNFRNISDLNQGKILYTYDLDKPIYKGLKIFTGEFILKMKGRKKRIDITVKLFSENMRGKISKFKVNLLSEKSVITKKTLEKYLY